MTLKFKRRKQEQGTSRRRASAAVPVRPQSFSYRASRVEQDYNLGRAQPREQDVRRRERLVRFWRQRLAVLLASAAVIICLLNILHISSNPKILPLTTSSNDYFLRPTGEYQHAASKLLAESILNDNKVTVNTDGIKQKLQQQFPELSSVSVTLPLVSHRPLIYISPRTPSLVLQTANGSFILDDAGHALLNTTSVADISKLQLPVVTDKSGLTVRIPQVTLPASTVRFITEVLAQLKAKGITAQQLTLPQVSAYELDLQPAGAGYLVKFNLHDTSAAREQAGTFLAVQQRLNQQSITPASYVDVRLVGRAYYR